MKVGHFNTLFRAFLFFLIAFCSSVALSDGSCYLTQNPSCEYFIRCEGDGVWINYVDHTNEVYVIENCETLKANLLAALDSVSSDLEPVYADVRQIVDSSLLISQNIPGGFEGFVISGQVDSITNSANSILHSLDDVCYDLTVSDGSFPTLRFQIEDIQCGSCPTNSSGSSCSDVDLTPILDRMNHTHDMLRSFTDQLSRIESLIGKPDSPFVYDWDIFHAMDYDKRTYIGFTSLGEGDILSLLTAIDKTLAESQSSINNYLYNITQDWLPNLSNNLEVVMSTTTNLYIASTNHFSFFREMTFQDSPLIDYSQQSRFGSYYDFLTNHYLKVSFKQYNSLLGDEKAKTNWFSRIETLLAALVFNDSESTNTVDDTYGKDQQNNLINSLGGMNQTSISQVNLMSSMGDSLLSSLRSLNSSFSSAVSMPSEVELVSVGSDNTKQGNTIKFQSSDISQLVEACRCATTLAWCFGGIWLLFLFVSWSIRTSYSLCVFCWSVVSAIFGGGKT